MRIGLHHASDFCNPIRICNPFPTQYLNFNFHSKYLSIPSPSSTDDQRTTIGHDRPGRVPPHLTALQENLMPVTLSGRGGGGGTPPRRRRHQRCRQLSLHFTTGGESGQAKWRIQHREGVGTLRTNYAKSMRYHYLPIFTLTYFKKHIKVTTLGFVL